MKRILGAAALAGALVLAASGGQAADKLTLQLKWVTQAQFAGYFVAKDKGFYKEVGDGVTVLKQGFNVDPLLQKQAACISTMTYNEYGQVLDAGLKPDQLVVFKYEDEGVATLEDGVYTLEKNLKDPAMAEKLARFLKASMKGWDYAVAHPDEGAAITLANDETGAQTEAHQKFMMGEIDKLVGTNPKGTGYLDPAAYDRTVAILLSGKSDPVIAKKPEGAWTHDVIDAAMK